MTRRLFLITAGTLSLLCASDCIGQPRDDRSDLVSPSDASYRLADGSVRVVGDLTMEPLVTRLNQLFIRDHPGIRFTLILRGPPTGIDGIVADVSLFAPLGREAWETEIEPFKRLTGYRPLDIRIGRRGYAGAGDQNPPGIYVHVDNPLRQLTMTELGRVLTAGQMPSDVRHWGQLDLEGQWAKHAIHVYGTRDDGRFVTGLRGAWFGGRPFRRDYEALAEDTDVLEAVAGDRYGIGVVDFVSRTSIPKNVRLVALAQDVNTRASLGEYDDVRQARYPLSPYLHLYVRTAPGQPLNPLAKQYIRLALSTDGQRLIEELKGEKEGYAPLAAEEVRQELAKIE